MIFVDRIQRGPTPWPGGRYSHLISDESVGELLEFAKSIGLATAWFQHRGLRAMPHYDVSPGFRARAIAAGARAVDRRGYVEAISRFRERNPCG